MKKFILLSLLFLTPFFMYSQSKMITISEEELRAIVTEEVKKAVDTAVSEAVAAVVKEYELKLLEKDIEIVNLKADRDTEKAEAKKYFDLWELEKKKNRTSLLKKIGIGVAGVFIGGGITYLITSL